MEMCNGCEQRDEPHKELASTIGSVFLGPIQVTRELLAVGFESPSSNNDVLCIVFFCLFPFCSFRFRFCENMKKSETVKQKKLFVFVPLNTSFFFYITVIQSHISNLKRLGKAF